MARAIDRVWRQRVDHEESDEPVRVGAHRRSHRVLIARNAGNQRGP